MNEVRCPECKGKDIDHWPEDSKFAYCYTCHETFQVKEMR